MIKAEIKDKELFEHLNTLHKDEMSIFVMADGLFRGAFFNGTRFVNQMRANHNLGILETLVLGQACLCGALMIPTMKGKDRLTFRYDTCGPAAGFVVNADSTGIVNGFLLQDPIPVFKPLESWDLSPFFGEGTVTVTHFLEGKTEPVSGVVEILHKNIAKDLAYYYLQSEQIHTAFNTSIQFDKLGRVIGAGGMFIQAMPGADDELIEKVEHAFKAAPSYGQWFSEKGDMDDIIYGLFREFEPNVALQREIKFDCHCNEEIFKNHLLNLDKKEITDICTEKPTEPIEIICHNCGSIYHFEKSQILPQIKN